eukprot:sb/3461584/
MEENQKWVNEKYLGKGHLHVNITSEGVTVRSGYLMSDSKDEPEEEMKLYFCNMMGYVTVVGYETNSKFNTSEGLLFNVETGTVGLLTEINRVSNTKDLGVVVLSCGPDDDFWAKNLSLAIKQDMVMLRTRDALKYQVMVDLSSYTSILDSDLSGSFLPIRTLGGILCQKLGYRGSTSMSFSNTSTVYPCIEIGPKSYDHISYAFRDMFEYRPGLGVTSENWKGGTSFHQFISLSCSREKISSNEIVLSALKDDLETAEKFTFSLVARYKNGDKRFWGLVCASSEITPDVLNSVCQDAGFLELWSFTTLGYKVHSYSDEEITQLKSSLLRSFGSGLMKITNLAAGEFSENKCGFNEVIQLTCLGNFDMTLMGISSRQNAFELPRYSPIPNSDTAALICSGGSTIVKQQRDRYCVNTNSVKFESTPISLVQCNPVLGLNDCYLEVGLRVTCTDEQSCTWKKERCSSFLLIECGWISSENLESSTKAVFVGSDTMETDLTTNTGTIGISIREFGLFTEEIPLSNAYYNDTCLLCRMLCRKDHSTAEEACGQGGFQEGTLNVSLTSGCNKCWPESLNNSQYIYYGTEEEISQEAFSSEATFSYVQQLQLVCGGQRLVLLNDSDLSTEGYPVRFTYDTGNLQTVSTVLVNNLDEADVLCSAIHGTNRMTKRLCPLKSGSYTNCEKPGLGIEGCTFDDDTKTTLIKSTYLKCLEPEEKTFIDNNEDSETFRISGGILQRLMSARYYNICVEHEMSQEMVTWFAKSAAEGNTYFQSVQLKKPSDWEDQAIGLWCTQVAGDPTCRYIPLPGCSSNVIAVNQYKRVQEVWMNDTDILTTEQGQVCADTLLLSERPHKTRYFGFAAGTHSVSDIVENTTVSHLVCENDKCNTGQDPPCTEGVVKLKCSNPNGVEYKFLNGTEQMDASTLTGVIRAVWNSELTIINLEEPINEQIPKDICGMLGFSSEVGSLQIRKSLKPATDKLLIGNFYYNCPLGMEDNYCHRVSEVESASAEKYFP